jgi:hypothetical protein
MLLWNRLAFPVENVTFVGEQERRQLEESVSLYDFEVVETAFFS